MRAAILCLSSLVLGSFVAGCGTYRGVARDAGGSVGDDAAISGGGDGGSDGGGSVPGAPPLGATPHPGGVSFRVWAPHAAHVFVVGDFNAWSATANELAAESAGGMPTGVFGGDVAGATVAQEYAYALTLADGTTVTHADPRARQLTTAAPGGHSIVVDPNAYAWQTTGFSPAPFNDTIVYELHVGSFVRPTPTTIGTWADAASKLDYLASLGINAVEIMPPVLCASDNTWGYNPSWPFATHNAYGSPADAKAFIDAAHARGIAVYIDIVHNHYSSKTGLSCWDGDCTANAYFYTDSRAQIDAVGAAPRLLRRPGARLHPRQRRRVARRVSRRRLALGLDHQHPRDDWDRPASPFPTATRSCERSTTPSTRCRRRSCRSPKICRRSDGATQSTAKGGLGFDTQWDAAFFHPVDDNLVTANDADALDARHLRRHHARLQRHGHAARRLHRGPRRGRQRQVAHPRDDLARQRRLARRAPTLDARRRDRHDLARASR